MSRKKQGNSKLNVKRVDQPRRDTRSSRNVAMGPYNSKKNVNLVKTESISEVPNSLIELRNKYRKEDGSYGISNYWIDHIFYLNREDVDKTTAYLEKDKELRNLIKRLHGSKKKSDVSQIVSYVRERNISLDDLNNIPVEHLKFDLHWFPCGSAMKYVTEIVDKMKAGYEILNNRSVDIQLFTGVGNHFLPSIRQTLLKEYEHQIKGDEGNAGVLILTILKNPTYSDDI